MNNYQLHLIQHLADHFLKHNLIINKFMHYHNIMTSEKFVYTIIQNKMYKMKKYLYQQCLPII